MKKYLILVLTMLLLSSSFAIAETNEVEVKIPDYDVEVNGVKIDTKHSQFPVLSYKNVTYFPMTSDYLSGIGINLEFSNESGLKISKKNELSDLVQLFLGANNELGSHVKAQIPSFQIEINGKTLNNSAEEYPIITYKNITYFPMTWRFAVTEFGWKTSWSDADGYGIDIVKHMDNERRIKTSTEIGELTDSVVMIEVTDVDGELSTGSGFFYNDNGGIITNIHVIVGAKTIKVIDNDGNQYVNDIRVNGYSAHQDIVVLSTKIDNNSHLKLVDNELKIGNEIYAIGSPFGLTNTLSEGIVSSITQQEIQITAAVSPGSSGGPLLNVYGECVGVVNAGIQDGENIGMAIPSRFVMNLNKKLSLSIKEFYSFVQDLIVVEIDGIVYVGEIKDDEFNGNGEFAYPNGDLYIGEIKDSLIEGRGTYYYASGSILSGTFVEDSPEYGTFTYYNYESGNVVYTGLFKDWIFNGKGKLTESDGSVYIGEFKDDIKDGQGNYTMANGDIYVGGFKDDEYHGQGTLTFNNGAIYVGGWLNGNRTGFGTYTYSNGDVKSGIWENNELVD